MKRSEFVKAYREADSGACADLVFEAATKEEVPVAEFLSKLFARKDAESAARVLDSMGFPWDPEEESVTLPERIKSREDVASMLLPDSVDGDWDSFEQRQATYDESVHRYNVFGRMLSALRQAEEETRCLEPRGLRISNPAYEMVVEAIDAAMKR